MKTYHIVYKTTNKINGKWYVGVHSTDDLNDGYLGSGKLLMKAVRKYGSNNFAREILHMCESREQALQKEADIVNESVVSDPQTYNLRLGGDGCTGLVGEKNPNYGKGYRQSGANNGRHKLNYNGDIKLVGKRISKALKDSKLNKKGNNTASKKYYVRKPDSTYVDIAKGFLHEYCDLNEMPYNVLYSTLHTKKPISKSKYPNCAGAQLFEGSYPLAQESYPPKNMGDPELKLTDRYEVLTSNGFQPFHGIKKVMSDGLGFKTDRGEVKVTKNHKFFNDGEFVYANSLKVGDTLNGETIVQISESPDIEAYYDLLEVHGGHHYTANGFEHSNCAFIKTQNWEEFADSVFPSQSALAWKKNIIISTAKGLNHFYDLVQNTKLHMADPDSKSTLVEVNWREVPRYDSDGALIDPDKFKERIIKQYGSVYFEQNYGNSFVGSSETLISPDVLNALEYDEPLYVRDDMLRIYAEPEENHVYVMGVDAAKDGKDFFAVQILDITNMPFRQVAAANLQVDYLTMPDYLYEWGAYFNTAHMIIENNEGAGQSIADMLVNHYEYPNIYYDDGKFRIAGFRTTKKSRETIIRLLQVLMNSAKLEICDKETISEFHRFELVDGKFQASSGHDDLVMSLAISLAPLAKMENYSDFGLFLNALKSDEILDTGNFFELDDLAFEDF